MMIAISIGNGSGDAQGSGRSLAYDNPTPVYAEFVEKEVLPLMEKQYNAEITKDTEGRAAAWRVGLPRDDHSEQPGEAAAHLDGSDRDLLNPDIMTDNMHDWVVANGNMAKAPAAKGYHYQFVFAKNASHTDGAVKRQTLGEALEYLWQRYSIAE